MDKSNLKTKLLESHDAFLTFVFGLTDAEFLTSKNNKWTPGQQVAHVYSSVKIVRQILSLPKITLKLVWGKANRPSKNYDELVEKYLLKLKTANAAPNRFLPKAVNLAEGKKLKLQLVNEVKLLNAKLDKFSEAELDSYILPHPLLVKLTLREMYFFTIYHALHHQKMCLRDLNS